MWLLDPKSFNAQNVAAGGKINFIKEQEKKKKRSAEALITNIIILHILGKKLVH